jgi:Photosynthesis affected mutant 68
MATEPQKPDIQQPEASLPFEPVSGKKKMPKVSPQAQKQADRILASQKKLADKKRNPAPAEPPKAKPKRSRAQDSGIPEVVSQRMGRRMTFFAGLPTLLGMLAFVASYFLVKNGTKLPTTAVLLVTLGLFGLGVVGLSYGVLSASWDENQVGTIVGAEQFGINWGRMTGAWKESGEQKRAAKDRSEDS